MSRYFTRPRQAKAWFEANHQPMLPNLDVPDHEAVETGLVDQRGDPIMRAPNPFGFGSKL
jgi:hypothetical protein